MSKDSEVVKKENEESIKTLQSIKNVEDKAKIEIDKAMKLNAAKVEKAKEEAKSIISKAENAAEEHYQKSIEKAKSKAEAEANEIIRKMENKAKKIKSIKSEEALMIFDEIIREVFGVADA